MDFLECKICHVQYDEEDHRPRNATCGHELCSACIKALIKDSILECPKCRQKNKVDVPDDLQINFGLVDVIRAFKTQTISVKEECEPGTSGVTNAELCKVHHKTIRHRCLQCQMWLCVDCLDSHTTLTGCSTIDSSNAVSSMKENQIEDVNVLLTMFKEGANYASSMLHVHSEKRKEHLERAKQHGEEEEKLSKLLDQGNFLNEKLFESRTHLNMTNAPYTVMDKIEVMTQRKQSLHSWTVKNLGAQSLSYLLKVLELETAVYAEMDIKGVKKHAKLLKNKEHIWFPSFRLQKVPSECITIPFDHLQSQIPKETSCVFMKLSLGRVKKGFVIVRLDEKLINLRENIGVLFTGQRGPCLAGATFNTFTKHDYIGTNSLPFETIRLDPDNTGRTMAKRGDVIGCFPNGYLSCMFISLNSSERSWSPWCVIGHIVSGLDILQDCNDNYNGLHWISDCGIVIKQE